MRNHAATNNNLLILPSDQARQQQHQHGERDTHVS